MRLSSGSRSGSQPAKRREASRPPTLRSPSPTVLPGRTPEDLVDVQGEPRHSLRAYRLPAGVRPGDRVGARQLSTGVQVRSYPPRGPRARLRVPPPGRNGATLCSGPETARSRLPRSRATRPRPWVRKGRSRPDAPSRGPGRARTPSRCPGEAGSTRSPHSGVQRARPTAYSGG